MLSPFFNTHRMVQEYTERFYLPAAASYRKLMADDLVEARALVAWLARIRKEWPQIQVEVIDTGPPAELPVGGEVRVQARVHLGAPTPDEVRVEVYAGRVDADNELTDVEATPMQLAGPDGDGSFRFETGHLPCRTSGLHGYTVRVLPHHPELTTPFQPGLITWIN